MARGTGLRTCPTGGKEAIEMSKNIVLEIGGTDGDGETTAITAENAKQMMGK